jgi:hypothetical protein
VSFIFGARPHATGETLGCGAQAIALSSPGSGELLAALPVDVVAADGPDIQPASVGIGKAQACAEAVVGVQPLQAALQSAALIFTKEKLSRRDSSDRVRDWISDSLGNGGTYESGARRSASSLIFAFCSIRLRQLSVSGREHASDTPSLSCARPPSQGFRRTRFAHHQNHLAFP